MFVTRTDLIDMLRGARDSFEGLIVGYLARMVPMGTLYSVSTEDSGENALVDQVRLWGASDDDSNEDAATEAGRIEQAGFLTIPRLNEPAQCIGDTRNAAYIPRSSPKYRPTGGQPGDTAHYSMSDGDPAVLWNREDGSASWQSRGSSKIELGNNGSGNWRSAGGANIALSATEPRVRVNETLHADHFAGGILIPVAIPGPALGTTPPGTVLATGTDAAFTLTLDVQDPAALPGLAATITFAKPYDAEPHLGMCIKSTILATPPPAGIAGALYVLAFPNTMLLFSTLQIPVGIHRLSLTVVG